MNFLNKKILPIVCLLIVYLFFEFVPRVFSIPSYVLPTANSILSALWNDKNILADHFLTTFFEWMLGLFISIFLGIFIGTFSLCYSFLEKILSPIFVVSQSIPYLIFIPFLLIWLGLGSAPKIFLVVLTCTFPIAMVLQKEFSSAKEEYQSFIQLFQLNFIHSLFHIYFPYSFKGFLKSLKISSCYSFGSTVIAELMGSENGLGVYLQRAQSSYRLDKMMCVVFIILVVTFIVHYGIDILEKKFIFWTEEKK